MDLDSVSGNEGEDNGSAGSVEEAKSTAGVDTDSLVQNSSENPRGEVSAATIGRMMGLATMGDLKLMEGKIDLISTRVNSLTVRMEKVLNILNLAPTGNDLERIDVQVGALRTLIKESLLQSLGAAEEGSKAGLSNAQIITGDNDPAEEEDGPEANAD
ncbi:hypothetical protein OAO01_00545 [Oligoflexia bacterium]|nr:hypothetical protein [Oligoflexia bacterium]